MAGIVVLGMHRSGTSAVTRVLHLLGGTLPPEEDLLTNYDNPDGHWESRTLVALNDRILAAYGRSWEFPPWLAPGWERSAKASALLPELGPAFSSVYDTEPWVWKDPRTCLTFPLWRRALGDDLRVVLVLRSASAVTRSIHRRDGIPRIYSAGLWLRYLRSALEGARGLPTVCVDFAELLRAPAATTTRLAEGLESLGVRLKGTPALAAASVHAATEEAERGDRVGELVERLSSPAAAAVDGLAAVSECFSPPVVHEPAWVRPLLFCYRGPWVVRARLGHPLGPRLP